MSALDIHSYLYARRLPLSNEKALQKAIYDELVAGGFPAEREVRLNDRDIIDLMVGPVGLECKIKGQRRAIYDQLGRYAKHDAISELILITNVPTGMPPEINGKPIYVLNLARAWI